MRYRFLPIHFAIYCFVLLSLAVQPVSGKSWETFSNSKGMFKQGPLPSDTVQALWTDGTVLWVGTHEGIIKFDGKSWSPAYFGNYWKIKHRQAEGYTGNVEAIPDNRINSILGIGDDVWFATDTGIVIYKTKFGTWEQIKFMHPKWDSGYIQVLVKGKKHLWIGSWGNGVAYYDLEKKTLHTFGKNDGFIGNHVTGIATLGDTIWVGTLNNGINKFNLKDRTWTHLHQNNSILPSNTIKALAAVGGDKPQIWISTDSGVLRIFPSEEFIPVFTTKNSGLSANSVDSLLINNNTTWFATRIGICSFHDETWSKMTMPSSLKGLRINQIISYQDSLWFATLHGGLLRYTP
ncbi:MAG: hypothetical protein QGH40_06490 [bacterium]|nr:hypothetical protein [bacterium]